MIPKVSVHNIIETFEATIRKVIEIFVSDFSITMNIIGYHRTRCAAIPLGIYRTFTRDEMPTEPLLPSFIITLESYYEAD